MCYGSRRKKKIYVPFSIIVNHIDCWNKMHDSCFNTDNSNLNKNKIFLENANGYVINSKIPENILNEYRKRWNIFTNLISEKFGPNNINTRWLLIFLIHQLSHLPTNEGRRNENFIREAKVF